MNFINEDCLCVCQLLYILVQFCMRIVQMEQVCTYE